MRKAFRAGPTTAPLETAGIGARPVGPGVTLTAGTRVWHGDTSIHGRCGYRCNNYFWAVCAIANTIECAILGNPLYAYPQYQLWTCICNTCDSITYCTVTRTCPDMSGLSRLSRHTVSGHIQEQDVLPVSGHIQEQDVSGVLNHFLPHISSKRLLAARRALATRRPLASTRHRALR